MNKGVCLSIFYFIFIFFSFGSRLRSLSIFPSLQNFPPPADIHTYTYIQSTYRVHTVLYSHSHGKDGVVATVGTNSKMGKIKKRKQAPPTFQFYPSQASHAFTLFLRTACFLSPTSNDNHAARVVRRIPARPVSSVRGLSLILVFVHTHRHTHRHTHTTEDSCSFCLFSRVLFFSTCQLYLRICQ